jgi:hypothetical protein
MSSQLFNGRYEIFNPKIQKMVLKVLYFLLKIKKRIMKCIYYKL